jgi:hypothetical protein
MRSRSSWASAAVSRPGARRPEQRHEQLEVAQVGLDGLRDPGVLDLDRDVAPVVGGPAVDLPDRRGGHGHRVDVAHDAADLLAPLLGHELLQPREVDPRRVVAQLREAQLDALGVLGLQAGQVDRAQHLAELHRRALHLAELHDDLLDDRGGALALRARLGVVGADAVDRAPAGHPRALAGDQPADARGAAEAGGRVESRSSWAIGGLRTQ